VRLDRCIPGVGRIARETGTPDHAVFKRINDALTHLAKVGNIRVLRGLRAGRVHPMELLELEASGRWRHPLPGSVEVRVYAMVAAPSGNIKLGITGNVVRRLNCLNSAHYERISLLCAVKGTPAEEQLLHVALGPYRIRGEWYRPEPPVLTAVERMRKERRVPILLRELQEADSLSPRHGVRS
jgi:hypothetical protein